MLPWGPTADDATWTDQPLRAAVLRGQAMNAQHLCTARGRRAVSVMIGEPMAAAGRTVQLVAQAQPWETHYRVRVRIGGIWAPLGQMRLSVISTDLAGAFVSPVQPSVGFLTVEEPLPGTAPLRYPVPAALLGVSPSPGVRSLTSDWLEHRVATGIGRDRIFQVTVTITPAFAFPIAPALVDSVLLVGYHDLELVR